MLVAAGLSVRSFLETRDTDTVFRRDGLLLASYDLTGRPATADTIYQCGSMTKTWTALAFIVSCPTDELLTAALSDVRNHVSVVPPR